MKKGFLILMIVPLCFVLFNNAVYRHQHVLSDGQRIEHAHPFQTCQENSCNGPNHQHTDSDIILYTLITGSPVIMIFLSLVPLAFRTKETDLGELYPCSGSSSDTIIYNLLRAPPQLL